MNMSIKSIGIIDANVYYSSPAHLNATSMFKSIIDAAAEYARWVQQRPDVFGLTDCGMCGEHEEL
jgi:hypothetical protein